MLLGRARNLLPHSHLSTLSQGVVSVYSEDVALNLVAQLGLEVTQFLLQARQRRENDGLRAQRTTGLHVVIKPEVTSQGLSHHLLCVEVQNQRAPAEWFQPIRSHHREICWESQPSVPFTSQPGKSQHCPSTTTMPTLVTPQAARALLRFFFSIQHCDLRASTETHATE